MRFDIITLFPEIFNFYFEQSILSRAQKNKIIKIGVHNLRDFAFDKHKTVDDKPFGGGRGMVLKIEPIYKAVRKLKAKKSNKTKVVLFTPRGKKFNQKMATDWAKLDQLILICGRYEGADERINKLVDEKVSIGDFVMMGGDLAGLIVVESVARLLKGVVGNSESLIGERITPEKGFVEYPQYTRPEVFETKGGQKWRTPKVLLSGNHQKIEKWRKGHSKVIE
ncbi:MAG: tRNA (guanosine(37)-N1)-methyltransferase TrmD [Candidatus Pacebacteria bacterium]|nr:tRNA (guanosine(37)-N1)-methyltransferase TrmD [Candidatus Paceibacterota bacterium]